MCMRSFPEGVAVARTESAAVARSHVHSAGRLVAAHVTARSGLRVPLVPAQMAGLVHGILAGAVALPRYPHARSAAAPPRAPPSHLPLAPAGSHRQRTTQPILLTDGVRPRSAPRSAPDLLPLPPHLDRASPELLLAPTRSSQPLLPPALQQQYLLPKLAPQATTARVDRRQDRAPH